MALKAKSSYHEILADKLWDRSYNCYSQLKFKGTMYKIGYVKIYI